MKTFLTATAFLMTATTANAAVPAFNGTCPTGIEVHVEEGGYVWINGKEAKLKVYDENTLDATHDHVTVSIMVNPDSTVTMMYTGKGGANGVCEVVLND